VSEPGREENLPDELYVSDINRFGEFLELGEFNAGSTQAHAGVCRAWLVFQHATVRRWMRDSRTLWPPMHEQLEELRKNLQQQNKQIDALCAGPYSFLAACGMKEPGKEPELFVRYCKDILALFNTLSHYDSFAKIFDQAYEDGDFNKVNYKNKDLDKYRIELSKGLESLAITLELMAETLRLEGPNK
jgi:hypothetical protein